MTASTDKFMRSQAVAVEIVANDALSDSPGTELAEILRTKAGIVDSKSKPAEDESAT